ncbi:hypothetical protein BDV95DRAFT_609918 [Massariosphaeria phaeospora]|uniref:Uncharacterized protein n=1 Tax=Massariosphaeria phaeospora TaxID=100035 RepID=A0A7C8I1M1_9PLEO|nr:hypothetical protein BDV95DRAFT_609918 [Massariosphaeria phaeospora]
MSGLLTSIQGVAGKLGTTFQNVLNKIISPEKRAEVLGKLQSFAMNNPKLAAFLTTQIVITGLPLVLFFTFSLTVFVFSLIAALLIGLVAALLFTVAMVGVALLVVLPTIFLTTFAACFIFLWGLGGYYILKWINEGDMPAPDGTGIGDKLNSLTGGRMSWLMDGARKKQESVADVENTGGSGEKANASEKKTNTSEKRTNGSEKKSSGSEKESGTTGTTHAPKKLESAKDTSSDQADGV